MANNEVPWLENGNIAYARRKSHFEYAVETTMDQGRSGYSEILHQRYLECRTNISFFSLPICLPNKHLVTEIYSIFLFKNFSKFLHSPTIDNHNRLANGFVSPRSELYRQLLSLYSLLRCCTHTHRSRRDLVWKRNYFIT